MRIIGLSFSPLLVYSLFFLVYFSVRSSNVFKYSFSSDWEGYLVTKVTMLTILEAAQFVRLRVQSNAFDYCQHIKPVEHNQIVKAILIMGSFYSSTGSTTNPLENLLGVFK